jgi:hypothetical protein
MINSKQTVEFARARTALKYGLTLLGVKPDSVVLVPDYLCNVVWHPLLQLGLQVRTYPVLDDLCPDWAALERTLGWQPAWAILMVHYFGQPQDIEDFRKFCVKHGLKLIEDAAHGHGGKHHGECLGTFGDIGISSPRKILNESFGGCLYIDLPHSSVVKTIQELPPPLGNIAELLKSVIRRYPKSNNWLKGVRGISRNWTDPFLFQESEKADWLISSSASARIRSAPWNGIAHRRRAIWQEWQEFSVSNGLKPVFDTVDLESCPWALPMYASNLTQRNRWLTWGARHGVPLFTWPALSTEVIESNGAAYLRWQRLLCFPLDVFPPKYKGVKLEN